MLANSTTIRDVSRALPALVSDPDLDVPVSADLLNAHAAGLRQRYESLLPVIDRAGNALADAMKTHDSQQIADPNGEGVGALEQGEAYFKHRREDLRNLRDAFVRVGASPSHDVFNALDHLDNLYMWIVATMQEVRWTVLIVDGVRDRDDSPGGRTFSSSSEWLASLNEE